MKHIDEKSLETDLQARFAYVSEFIGLSPKDVESIHGAVGHLAPLVPQLVDAVYAKLYQQDATWRHFATPQAGYQGDVPEKLEDLTPDHPIIKFRKEHLAGYLVALVTKPYDGKMVQYLDWVGKIHTSKAGSPRTIIPIVQIDALMGFVADALIATVYALNLPRQTEMDTIRAFQKLLWIQNDLFVRHYASATV
ncbi:hypothetical protein GC170_22210 [bacterium]|nr:hypothetical protein [bacterium]